jgi:hypothetical protein
MLARHSRDPGRRAHGSFGRGELRLAIPALVAERSRHNYEIIER